MPSPFVQKRHLRPTPLRRRFLAKVPMKVFDLGVSICWLLVYVKASLAMRKERRLAEQTPKFSATAPRPATMRPKRSLLVAAVVLGGFLVFLAMLAFVVNSLQ